MISIADRLKELRERMGLNQTEFCKQAAARGLNISVRRYRQIESGKAKVSLNEVGTIISALGVGASTLLFNVDAELPKAIIGKKERRAVARPVNARQ